MVLYNLRKIYTALFLGYDEVFLSFPCLLPILKDLYGDANLDWQDHVDAKVSTTLTSLIRNARKIVFGK